MTDPNKNGIFDIGLTDVEENQLLNLIKRHEKEILNPWSARCTAWIRLLCELGNP